MIRSILQSSMRNAARSAQQPRPAAARSMSSSSSISSISWTRVAAVVGVSALVATTVAFNQPIVHAEAKKTPTPSAATTPAAVRKSAAGVQGGIERTFIAIKPDGTQRGLVGDVISRFERKGYKLVGIKAIVPSRSLAEKHYEDLKTRPFFAGLVNYMTSGAAPVIAMVWEGKDVIRQGRRLIGATNPLEAQPGTIRGDFCISVGRNIIHGSDSFESAEKEISLWFGKSEVYDWEFGNAEWITAEN